MEIRLEGTNKTIEVTSCKAKDFSMVWDQALRYFQAASDEDCMEIAAETCAVGLQKSLELRNIALVEQALASARLQAERDGVALREAELLFEQGRRTTLELEQLRLNLERARIQTYKSAVEVYRVLGVYLLLFVAEGA